MWGGGLSKRGGGAIVGSSGYGDNISSLGYDTIQDLGHPGRN